jgi:hypothetical protein
VGSYPYRQTVRVLGTFRDADGQLTDPPGVQLSLRAPNGVVTVYLLTDVGPVIQRLSEGLYAAIIRVMMTGRWQYAWSSTEADAAGSQPAEEGYFDVKPSAFAA